MKLVFARSHRPGSLLIRLGTFSNWSHVGVVTDLGVIETTFPKGVHVTPWREFVDRHSAIEEIEVALPDEAAARRFLISQLGKKYDWTAIVGFVFREPWARAGRWFCSELVEAACIAGGRRRFRDKLSRITPRHSWMVSV